ncbi:hypothetical protein GCM10027298_26150 [Epidermidibacterium keratini]
MSEGTALKVSRRYGHVETSAIRFSPALSNSRGRFATLRITVSGSRIADSAVVAAALRSAAPDERPPHL